jgi:4-hydroxy-tetrahydrodipicolinate synthase
VIASGHISDSLTEQIKEINKIAETGIDTMILVTNNLAQKDESDDIWKQNMETLLGQIPDSLPLGLYECPHPYKRLLSTDLIQWITSTNRFYFFKDTSCDDRIIQHRLKTLKGTRMKLYNANSATLFATLTMGAAGYTGVMANFHPELYIKGIKLLEISSEKAEELFQFLSLASVIERQFYPVNAKYHLQLEGLPIQLYSRVKDHREFSSSQRLEVEHLRAVAKRMINV